MNKRLLLTVLELGMLAEGLNYPFGKSPSRFYDHDPHKEKRKCLRHGCENMVYGKKSYCSAECCKEDKQRVKQTKQ